MGDAMMLRKRPIATPCDCGMQATPRHHPALHDATQLNGQAPPRCHDVAQKARRCFILAAPNSFYLDCGAGGWVGNNPGRNSWCKPFKTWQNAYTFDPLANLTAAQPPLVLSGQQQLWTEQPGPQNLDSIVWPCTAATAEESYTSGTPWPIVTEATLPLGSRDMVYMLRIPTANATGRGPEEPPSWAETPDGLDAASGTLRSAREIFRKGLDS
ncbi:hypothetical protein EDB89DRAFT_2168792 [Lactarius sanguifluus]|nr:hypothetical protein EDB89DRAFT_2168792 [Lactarius sanguifluus]